MQSIATGNDLRNKNSSFFYNKIGDQKVLFLRHCWPVFSDKVKVKAETFPKFLPSCSDSLLGKMLRFTITLREKL